MVTIRRYLAVLLVLLVAVLAVMPALADELEQKQQELQSMQQQMQQQKERAARAQTQVNSVSERLRSIQGDLDVAQKEYSAIQDQLEATEKKIEVNGEILAKAEDDLADRSQVLNKRMRDIYKNGQVNYLDVLFGANDFNDFVTRMDILKRVARQDVDLVNKVKAERELILAKKAELETDRANIVDLKKAAEEKKALISARKQEQQKTLDSAISERDQAESAYQELQENSRQIEQMIRRIQPGNAGSAGGSGALMWPASGPITSPFGWRTHPIFGTARYHSGIDIGADYGDTVVAADSGVVIFADWMGGYGKAVVIDHGGGVSTLYGHNSELLVSEGQRVSKGQAISRVGATGYATGPHLHFEVRENGSPVDPMSYLP
ncbi:murein hydrolase activator EnvC family protein [Propionispora vibrioides]|uniref:Septal ring factor EnvC, activator of murein hydrolases AmiA and AmiB n=1 Tax=Propionispora vibrioides TaxID=112903 RepID=A0A1H8RTV3_9FIRM|nr:peptidoglycan DD-metalloendopeptidase family protein [Propionispora vibrioides]SEO69727.1 Septal ring factor EnvC, activator of murein hydrolases AmiA and AmiB [Propionispora vibrioides]